MIQRFIMEVNLFQFIFWSIVVTQCAYVISWSIKDFVEWKQQQKAIKEYDRKQEKVNKIRKDYRKSFIFTGPHPKDKHFIGVDWADPKKRPLTYMVCGVRYGKMEHFRWNSQRLNG